MRLLRIDHRDISAASQRYERAAKLVYLRVDVSADVNIFIKLNAHISRTAGSVFSSCTIDLKPSRRWKSGSSKRR